MVKVALQADLSFTNKHKSGTIGLENCRGSDTLPTCLSRVTTLMWRIATMNTLPLWPQDDKPMKRCPTCPEGQQWHPATPDYFHRQSAHKDGLTTHCKRCRNRRPQPKQEYIPLTEKICLGPCGRTLPATSEYFQSHNKAKDGLLNECKECRDVTRICGVCGTQKARRIVSGKSRYVCKECARRSSREAARRKGPVPITDARRAANTRNRNKVRASGLTNQRVYRLRAHFGIKEEDYLQMLEAQHGCCAICKVRLAKRVHVDHDHETGNVRGLLCERCNIGLGYFSDSPERMRDAALYIESRRESWESSNEA